MKRLVLFVFALALATSVKAQEGLNAGVFLGVPLIDGSDIATFTVGADVNYLFNIVDKVQVGPATGFGHAFGKDNFDDFQYIPFAAAGRYQINEMFTAGVDLGFTIGLNDYKNGFYFRPTFCYSAMENLQLNASFIGIDTSGDRYDATYGAFVVGASYNFDF